MTAKLAVKPVVLAATLAVFSVVGCSSEKSTAPKALASVTPQEKPVQPSPKAPTPPPRSTDPPLALATAASPPAKDQESAEDKKPPEAPDPWDGVSAEKMDHYKQFKELLEPPAKAAKAVTAGALQTVNEERQRMQAVRRLGEYMVSFNREAETNLRALLNNAEDTKTKTHEYLSEASSILAGQEELRLLSDTYEDALDGGADIPAEMRKKVAELRRQAEEKEARRQLLGGFIPQADGLQDVSEALSQEAEELRMKLLEQSVRGDDLFELAYSINQLGQAVISSRQQTDTASKLVMALPEPYRTHLLLQLVWSPILQAEHESQCTALKGKLRQASLDLPRDREQSETIADAFRKEFLASEERRRNAIGGYFHDVDADGWQALVALDSLLAKVQAVLKAAATAPDEEPHDPNLSYQIRPLIPADRPHEDAANVLPIIPLPGSPMDRAPTVALLNPVLPSGIPSTVFELKCVEPTQPPLTYADVARS